jgi:hypothetical protein
LPLSLVGINWQGDGKNLNITDSGGLFDFGAATYKRARNGTEPSGKNTSEQCVTFKPSALSAIWYTEGATLPLHQDSAAGWVLTISVGCSAIFNYSTDSKAKPSESMPKVQLDSGDVLLFNCTKWLHSVSQVLPASTAPLWWTRLQTDLEVRDLARFCLQFRDSSHV